MCCAIPGLEEFLYALSVSLTAEYYPGLHLDTADVEAVSGVGTAECIVFSSHDQAVFVAASTTSAGGSEGMSVRVIELRSPTMILLDSTRVYHAACRNREVAQVALDAMRSRRLEATAAGDRARGQSAGVGVRSRSVDDAVLRFDAPSVAEWPRVSPGSVSLIEVP
eukprot:SAG11_NODE_11724_length_742_cov_0.777605_2_plen_165_part_01